MILKPKILSKKERKEKRKEKGEGGRKERRRGRKKVRKLQTNIPPAQTQKFKQTVANRIQHAQKDSIS